MRRSTRGAPETVSGCPRNLQARFLGHDEFMQSRSELPYSEGFAEKAGLGIDVGFGMNEGAIAA